MDIQRSYGGSTVEIFMEHVGGHVCSALFRCQHIGGVVFGTWSLVGRTVVAALSELHLPIKYIYFGSSCVKSVRGLLG